MFVLFVCVVLFCFEISLAALDELRTIASSLSLHPWDNRIYQQTEGTQREEPRTSGRGMPSGGVQAFD